MMKTNKEVELMANLKNSWLLAYAGGSEFYIPNALHVERNDNLMLVEDDEQASKEAEKAGIPMIYDMDGVPNGVYVDTEENREIITKMLNIHPEYKKEENKTEKLVLTYIGIDNFSRPVYKNEEGKLFKDVDPRKHRNPEICTVYGGFEGEPDTPIIYISKYKDVEIEFIPHRITV